MMLLRNSQHNGGRAMMLLCLVFLARSASSFVVTPPSPPRRHSTTQRHASQDSVDGDMNQLRERLQQVRVGVLEKELERPPNPQLSPADFVSQVLLGLLDPYDPLPDAGFRRLLRASSPQWRERIYYSLGAPRDAPLEGVASSLGSALGRPNQQFGILVGLEDEYNLHFPTDLLDFEDGTCWLECRLRGKNDNSLLVAMGWSLKQGSDGSWLIDGIDWQDFRDRYRPGIGREEWMRICG